jgi:hypothetical protein
MSRSTSGGRATVSSSCGSSSSAPVAAAADAMNGMISSAKNRGRT